ncbi:MAG: carbamoyltransferase [Chitinophagales bacterium]
MTILGISAYYHDSAAAIITDGNIIAAAQEERFSRIKNDKGFPHEAIGYCLSETGKTIDELDAVVFYDKTFLKFERLIETYYYFAPRGILSFFKSIPSYIGKKIFIKKNIREGLGKIQPYSKKKLTLLFSEHHLSHAASAFFSSGFSEAAILTIDGVGEWATCTICKANGNRIEILKELRFPHSVGLLYSAFTYYLGFAVNSGEYKLMGLAPYGNPDAEETARFSKLIRNDLVSIFDDGSILLNQAYFEYAYGLRMTNNKRFERLFGLSRRMPDAEFTQDHVNLAYAIQQVTEEIVLKLAAHAKQLTGSASLCMAGGVALNAVANGKLERKKIFSRIFIQPAAGDAGGAIGAALAVYHIHFDQPLPFHQEKDRMSGSYLGPSFSNDEILSLLEKNHLKYKSFTDFSELCTATAAKLAAGNVIGWFQGRMEFGPRALGNRSILANAGYPDMQKTLNLKIKFRENFRPFAPAVAAEDAADYFEAGADSPFMLLVRPVKKSKLSKLPDQYNQLPLYEKLYYSRSAELQATTHVDGTARLQTVSEDKNPRFYRLLKTYKNLTGCGVLINTSFNVKDEPIVCSPQDALSCFLKTGMNDLVIGNFMLSKELG